MLDVAQALNGRVLPDRVMNVLANLQKLYPSLRITSLDHSEIVFYVPHMTDSQLIQTLITQNAQIFGTGIAVSGAGCVLGPADFQILCDLNPAPGAYRGLSLFYLPNVGNRSGYTAGYWYL